MSSSFLAEVVEVVDAVGAIVELMALSNWASIA